MACSSRAKCLVLVLLTILLVSVGSYALFSKPDLAARAAVVSSSATDPDASAPVVSEMDYSVYLPIVYNDYGPRSSRMGFCAAGGSIDRYSDIRKLSAGWYLRFTTMTDPPRPLGMEHVQVVRIHQRTECWPTWTRDRTSCPYVEPYEYVVYSSGGVDGMLAAAQANPGALWFIGNEMDRRDWDDGGGGGQDERLPELYATAYYELRNQILAEDPTARFAIGGVVQATPARLGYLTKIWNSYQDQYGSDMPVDVWNVHNFIFKEKCDDYGADVPPGDGGCYGTVYDDRDHNNMQIFDDQIRAMRQWMKDRGQQQKPLIVSEYGIVYYHAGMEDLNLVRRFMLDTFGYFMNTKECSLGLDSDECRLVQRWAWYSLNDNSQFINRYSHLIDPDTGLLTPLGQTFADYANQHLDTR